SGSVVIHQHFALSAMGDDFIEQIIEEAANKGALEGAQLARENMMSDFSSNGQARRMLNV
ncbi:MAG TPA: hypothetical protein VGH05_06400, partial [Buttiauxella sp.]